MHPFKFIYSILSVNKGESAPEGEAELGLSGDEGDYQCPHGKREVSFREYIR